MRRRAFLRDSLVGLGGMLLEASGAFGAKQSFDIVVYGATASGVVAAVAAAREGARVALLDPGTHLGGIVSSGLGHTDTGRKETIGGICREFFKRVGKHYGKPIAWDFEPHVASDVFAEMVHAAKVNVFHNSILHEYTGVKKHGNRIVSIETERGNVFSAPAFIDATYEGDLMGRSGVTFTWGREGRDKYDESLAGVREGHEYSEHWFKEPVSAYGGHHKLLPNINHGPCGKPGAGDKKVQAYCFRLCLTKVKDNQVPIPKPFNYDAHNYELLARLIEALKKKQGSVPRLEQFISIYPLPHGKTDVNSNGAFSTDYVGKNWCYPTASYERRGQLWREHADYTAGFFHFLAHDRHVPKELKEETRQWGLARDEFDYTNYWPPQLYVRESRRMVGEYVMTQHDAETDVTKPDPIGMGSYNIDSRNVQRYAKADGDAQNEGNTEVPAIPYQIPYRALLPRRDQCTNLLVPVCVSASHIGYGTLRMEPVYMIMGQAAGVAAALAMDHKQVVQDVESTSLKRKLKSQGVVMEWTNPQHLKLKPVI